MGSVISTPRAKEEAEPPSATEEATTPSAEPERRRADDEPAAARPKRNTGRAVKTYAEEDVGNPYKPASKRQRVGCEDALDQGKTSAGNELYPKHITRDKMANIRDFIRKTQASPSPLVDNLHKAQDADVMRFVRMFLVPETFKTTKQLMLAGPQCDMCRNGSTKCRRVQNMMGYAKGWGYTEAQCRAWPSTGITWHDKSHNSYIFFKCTKNSAWDEGRIDAFRAALESIAWN